MNVMTCMFITDFDFNN